MKKCPKCQKSYQDDLNFCLQDGSPLVEEVINQSPSEADTQVITSNAEGQNASVVTENVSDKVIKEREEPIRIDIDQNPTAVSSAPIANYQQAPASKSSAPIFILMACVFLVLGIAGGAGLFWFIGSLEGSKTKKPKVVTVKETPPDENYSPPTVDIGEDDMPTETPSPTATPKKTPKDKVKNPSDDEFDEDDDDFDEPDPTPTPKPKKTATPKPKPKGCYLHDGGKGGGEVRVRVYCDRYDCTQDSRTIAGRAPNKTPVKRLSGRVSSGGFTWVRISIYGRIGWVAASKIRCS